MSSKVDVLLHLAQQRGVQLAAPFAERILESESDDLECAMATLDLLLNRAEAIRRQRGVRQPWEAKRARVVAR